MRPACRPRPILASMCSCAAPAGISGISSSRRRPTGCRTRWKRPRCRRWRTCWRSFESGERPATAEAIQEEIYNVGRSVPRYQDLKAKGATPERPGVSIEWFNTIYQVLLGEPRGPRFGSFVALYGVKETRALIRKALAGELVSEHEASSKDAGDRLRRLKRLGRSALAITAAPT